MSKLLYANIVRLKSDTSFRLGMLAMVVIGMFLPLNIYSLRQRHLGYTIPAESSFLTYIMLTVIFAAVFCSLYIGTEYSDGTIRNKIIVGHTRTDIYLSNLIVCIAAEIIMSFVYIAAYVCVGVPLLGSFSTPFDIILCYIGCSVVLCIAVAAIYTFIAMLNQNRAVTSVICILGIFFLIFAGAYLNARLNEPEVYDAYTYFNADGVFVQEPAMENPYYIDEPERAVCEFLNDFLPGNQTVRLSQGETVHFGAMALYSGIIAVMVTGLGIFFFRKEDIK